MNWTILDHKKFDTVMRFESLASDFSLVKKQLNLDVNQTLTRVNPTKKNPLPEILTSDRLRKKIEFAFSPLMKFWDYQFPADLGLKVENRMIGDLLFRFNCAIRSGYWRMKK